MFTHTNRLRLRLADPVEPSGAGTPATTEDPVGDQAEALGDPGKRALAAERTARKAAEQAAADALARIKEIEDANLSDLEKARRDAEDARTALAAVEQSAIRDRVALAKGVPADLADLLTGTTEEEVAAKADLLMARIGTQPSAPRPDLSQSSVRDGAKSSPEADFATFLQGQIG